MNCRILFLIAFTTALFFAGHICAAGAADKQGQDQSKRLQQQLRAAEREKSQMTAKKAEVEAQLKEAQEALTSAKQKADAAARRGATLTRGLEKLNSENDILRTKLADTQQALAGEQRKLADTERRLAEAVRQGEEQRREFMAEKLRLNAAVNASRERNERMYKLGFELIDRYERAAVSQAEPITGLRRAQIEKMAEKEREMLDKDRLPPVANVPAQEQGAVTEVPRMDGPR
jgi:chromosome segregation ATPase